MNVRASIILVAFTLLVFGSNAFAQPKRPSFSRIDWDAQQVSAATPEALAHQLTAGYTTDADKVRAIFRWITENIAYAMPSRVYGGRAQRYKSVPMDTLLAMKSVDEIVAYTVMQKRSAVCNGYARLFKTLCSFSGIRAEVVSGYARGGMGNSAFRSNHSWNAVLVDSVWRLVDATWASGFISYSNDFVKQYDDSYFFPDPERFIRTHYPEDLRWALVANPPALAEFYQAPFKLTAFMKYGIGHIAPARGVLDVAVGDTVQFQFDLKSTTVGSMAPELDADSMLMYRQSAWDFVKPSIIGNQVSYNYIVQSGAVEWLHLVYNDDVILRYKLNIRRP